MLTLRGGESMQKEVIVCDGCGKQLERNSQIYHFAFETDFFWNGVESIRNFKQLDFCPRCAEEIKEVLKRLEVKLDKETLGKIMLEDVYLLVRDILSLEEYIAKKKEEKEKWDDAVLTVIAEGKRSIHERAKKIWESKMMKEYRLSKGAE